MSFRFLSRFPSVPMSFVSHRSKFAEAFQQHLTGYHYINEEPLKEAAWEDINAQILKAAGCTVTSQSGGSHKPGADLCSSIGALSNKSTQYDAGKRSFKISSYRLTTVCSDKSPGSVDAIQEELDRRKNFDAYSILVRSEEAEHLEYDWYLIPADCPALNHRSYTWVPKLGKIGKNKGAVTGWETNTVEGSSMSITFSMSSQLWMEVQVTDELKSFIVGSCRVKKGRKISYLDLYKMFTPGAPEAHLAPEGVTADV
jgi:hypothetical protein